jgi:intraflagellar transport protein 172
VVAHTTDSLLVGDSVTGKSSEVTYNYAHHAGAKKGASASASSAAANKNKEKFFFDNENACMVFNSGELTIIEYGSTTPIEPLRTEYVSPHLLSVRISDARSAAEQPVKKIAYLLDAHTIRVVDLSRGFEEASISHDNKIDWLELNARASKLLFRDKRRALHLYDLATQQRHTLLSFCNYVQWVPDSDVVVAQSRRTLSVWYSIDNPADVTNFVIRGDVEQIERTAGRTEVLIDEGVSKTTIALDEALIAFGAAVDAHDFAKAGAILDALKEKQARELGAGNMSSGAEAMWTQLSRLALDEGDFTTAERCFSALGDVSKTKYLHKINALLLQNGGDTAAYLIQAHVAILHGRFKAAEHVLLNQGKVDEVVQMYRNAHQWPEALAVAEAKGWPHLQALKNQYFQYLLQTQQEEVAGEFKERNQEYQEALALYLKGGYPARAANLVMQQGMTGDAALCERVASALIGAKSFEKAGEFLEALKQNKRALECYQRGHHYNKAVALCRRDFPAQVVQLYEEWGDWSVEHCVLALRAVVCMLAFRHTEI